MKSGIHLSHKNSDRLMRSLKIAAVAMLVIPVVACGDSTKPSESEAKKSIAAIFKDCELIKVGNFEKLNGVPTEQNQYKVSVKFTLKSVPTKKPEDLPGLIIPVREARAEGCQFRSNNFTDELVYQLFSDGKGFAKSVEKEFNADLQMIKTDNGWVSYDSTR